MCDNYLVQIRSGSPGAGKSNKVRRSCKPIMSDMTFLSLAQDGTLGTLSCSQCDFRTKLTIFGDNENGSITTFQCKDCGIIQERENALLLMIANACECGGSIIRNAPLFCPTCKSAELEYQSDSVI